MHPQPTVSVGVGVLIVRNERLLLGQRRGSHGAGTWAPPGGHLEFGESVAACARREVFEETGLQIQDITNLGFTNDIFAADHKHYVTLFVLAQQFTGEPHLCEPEKCSDWRWFDWSNLPEPLFAPLDQWHRQQPNLPGRR